MKAIGLIFLFMNVIVCFPSYADSLEEISIFAKDICDEIRVEGVITREKIEGKLHGEVKGIAELLGASVGAEGIILVDELKYKGLPYEKLSDQMKDARDCRKQLATMLIQERKKVSSGTEERWKSKRGTWNFNTTPFFAVGERDFNKSYLSGRDFSNVIYEVRLRKISKNDGPFGLLVRYDDKDDEGYMLLIWPLQGKYQFSRIVGEKRHRIASGSPKSLKTGASWNTIRVTLEASNFDITINGHQVVSLSDDNYYLGKVGLVLHGSSKNRAEFDIRMMEPI